MRGRVRYSTQGFEPIVLHLLAKDGARRRAVPHRRGLVLATVQNGMLQSSKDHIQVGCMSTSSSLVYGGPISSSHYV